MKKQTLAAAIFLSVLNSSMALSAAPKVEEPPFEGYLFAYFEGRGDAKQQEHLRFALSDDGVNWRALNENRPVIASDTISESGGIRDPHILRGEDGLLHRSHGHEYRQKRLERKPGHRTPEFGRSAALETRQDQSVQRLSETFR